MEVLMSILYVGIIVGSIVLRAYMLYKLFRENHRNVDRMKLAVCGG